METWELGTLDGLIGLSGGLAGRSSLDLGSVEL
jgi:hypothetical protein